MDLEVLEKLPALVPMEFFSMEGEFHYSKSLPSSKQMRRDFMLFDASSWTGEEHFADVAAFWNESGLYFNVYVNQPFQEACYPRFSEGDAVELFLDTRDLKQQDLPLAFATISFFSPRQFRGSRTRINAFSHRRYPSSL